MRTRPQSISESYWAGRLALFSVALIVVAGVFHRLFGMSTPLALNLFTIAFLFSFLALAFGGYALVRIWRTGLRGTAASLAGMALAGLVLCWPLSQVPKLRALPTLNDVTTDTSNPPPFIKLANLRPKGANPVAYPGATAAALQHEAYRDLKPLVLRRSVDDAFDLVGLALRRLRMTTVNVVPVVRGRGDGGLVEAYDRTLLLGFYDDVAVRVRAVRGGSRIDVRSASRYGTHDLGRNAERVRAILNEIVAQADGSVPGRGRGLRNRQQTSDNRGPDPVTRPAIRRP
jgi:uncharacterized protein (DUF1499 family)